MKNIKYCISLCTTVLLLSIISLYSTNSVAYSTEKICNQVKPTLKKLQKQLPIQIDYATSFVGVFAVYLNPVCLLHYSFLINAEGFVKAILSNEDDLTVKEAIDFIKTKEGHLILKKELQTQAINNVNTTLGFLTKHKGIRIKYVYQFDNYSIKPIIVIGADTTKNDKNTR